MEGQQTQRTGGGTGGTLLEGHPVCALPKSGLAHPSPTVKGMESNSLSLLHFLKVFSGPENLMHGHDESSRGVGAPLITAGTLRI